VTTKDSELVLSAYRKAILKGETERAATIALYLGLVVVAK